MSRSKKRKKNAKCICGLRIVNYIGYGKRHIADCPVLFDVYGKNEMFLKFKKLKCEPFDCED